MRHQISSADIDRFRCVIAGCLGLQFEDAKLGFLEEVLRRRLEVATDAPDVYLARLETENPDSDEAGALSQELTVPETYFFRNSDQFRAFADVALPDRMRAQSDVRRLRILSAGCASGEEAYSLAVLVREAVIDPSWDVSILGVDVNPAMMNKAKRARFSEWALRDTPADVRSRWFKREGRDFVLDHAVQSAVRFEERNLVRDDPQLWQPDTYDIIFFRNVLMYFTSENAHAVIARMGRALRVGGYLFLGHAETLRGLSNDFHLRHTHETFYYQLKDPLERLTPFVPAVAPLRGRPRAVVAGVEAGTWFDAIHRAAERVEILTRSPALPARPCPGSGAGSRTAAAKPTWTLEAVHDLLREERFTEALDTMQRLPPEAGRDPDVLLLRAALLTHRGQFAEAEEACERLLDVDELSAGAHYLLALCREGVRDLTGAENHDQVAIYLDPGFAMPHLHLGLLGRRAGDRTAAQNELERALLLLQREDVSRLLLFGGGFNRETLVELCRTELLACGGKP
jgi:chemotaxis protein methyltransferase CheR